MFFLLHFFTASHKIWTFLVSAGRPRSVQGNKIQSRSPPAQSLGGVQKSCALTSLEVAWDWWGRRQVGRAGAQGGAEPPHRWPARLPAKIARKPRRHACRRGREWLTNGWCVMWLSFVAMGRGLLVLYVVPVSERNLPIPDSIVLPPQFPVPPVATWRTPVVPGMCVACFAELCVALLSTCFFFLGGNQIVF